MSPNSKRGLVPTLASALVLVVAAGCGGGDGGSASAVRTVTEQTAERTVTVRADGSPFHPVTDTAWPADSPFTAEGARQIVNGLAVAIGQDAPRVTSIALYGSYVGATVVDPVRPRQSDNWSWRDGAWSGPEPQSNRDADELAAAAFVLEPERFAVVPTIVERVARLASDIEDIELVYIGLERSSSYDGRVVWRAVSTSPRESSVLYFALDGTLLSGG